jgi:signal transduction histidine kinase
MGAVRVPLRVVAGVAGVLAVVVVVVWAVSGGGEFWPRWAWFGLAVGVGARAAVGRAMRVPAGRRRRLALCAAVYSVLAPLEVTAWLLSGRGYFWPIWPLLGLSAGLGVYAWLTYQLPPAREQELSRRIDTLARTRRGALDSQATELQRIERDLHDGAQARMVSLGMSLGLAEHLLRSDPDAAAALVAEARASTLSALDELRTVMQTIHPPVLADRGLLGAIQALAVDLAVPVTVTSALPAQTPQAPAAIESALYFATAECLANVVKHSHATAAAVGLVYRDGTLVATVTDDGIGGASPDRGTGLGGVARRLEAFDGTMVVHSPAGGPTTVTMEVPCELSSPRISPSSGTG